MASGRLANFLRKIRPNRNPKVLQDLGMEPHEFLKAMDDPEFLNNLAERQSYIIDGVIHLDKYVETKLGEIPYTIDEMIPVLDDFSIAVQVVKPRGDRDFIALVTYGMSGAPLEQIGEDYKYAELMIKWPANGKYRKN